MENISLIQRIVNLFFTPSKAFDGLSNGVSYKDWLYPLLIVTAGIAILPLFYRDISIDEGQYRLIQTERAISNNPDYSDEQKTIMLEKISGYQEKVEDARENPWALQIGRASCRERV